MDTSLLHSSPSKEVNFELHLGAVAGSRPKSPGMVCYQKGRMWCKVADHSWGIHQHNSSSLHKNLVHGILQWGVIMNLVERGRAGNYFIPNSSTSLTLQYINNREVIFPSVLNMFKKQGAGCFVNVNQTFTTTVELRCLLTLLSISCLTAVANWKLESAAAPA